MGVNRKDTGVEARSPEKLERVDRLATALHASFLDRWGRHDPAGLERAIAERRTDPAQRTSVA